MDRGHGYQVYEDMGTRRARDFSKVYEDMVPVLRVRATPCESPFLWSLVCLFHFDGFDFCISEVHIKSTIRSRRPKPNVFANNAPPIRMA